MPPKSKAQARFLRAVCSGRARNVPKSLTKEMACEMVEGFRTRQLPERKSGRRRRQTR